MPQCVNADCRHRAARGSSGDQNDFRYLLKKKFGLSFFFFRFRCLDYLARYPMKKEGKNCTSFEKVTDCSFTRYSSSSFHLWVKAERKTKTDLASQPEHAQFIG
jgi:hypothetical protein